MKSVQRVYFGLAVFNVTTVLLSVVLGQGLMSTYRASVADNEQWAQRLARFARIGQLVTQANGPGNDVFVNHDAALERANLTRLSLAANAEFDSAEHDLSSLPGPEAAPFLEALRASRREFDTERGLAQSLLVEFEAGRLDEAGALMGQMDQAFARSTSELDALRSRVQRVQAEQFSLQLAAAERSQFAQYGLIGFVVLMVVAAVVYGFRLQRTLQRSQAAVDQANAGMRLVLDNVDQGLITVDLEGRVTGEQSDRVSAWLGVVAPGEVLWSAWERLDPRAAAWLRAGWGQVAEGLMPLEVSLDQLPRRMVAGRRQLDVGYRPIHDGGALRSVLVVFTDVTETVRSQQAEAEQAQSLAIFERLLRERLSFLEAFADCERLVGELMQGGDAVTQRRRLHTLKGNAASLGLTVFARCCHQLEDESDGAETVTAEQLTRLGEAFAELRHKLDTMTGEEDAGAVTLDAREYAAMVQAAQQATTADEARTLIEAVALEPVGRRLEQLASEARGLAQRLGRGEVQVEVDAGSVRYERAAWGPFFSSLVHVVRNAVDHGLERLEDRRTAGKGPGRVRLSTRLEQGQLRVEVSDDGRGIDVATLLRRARSAGLEGDDVVAALFADGVSTRDGITDLSGRGVGLAAVRAEVERRGGTISVESRAGGGTLMTFSFPARGVTVVGRPVAA